ncbi:MAG: hypothetical protein D3923_12370 [Candidatus Electrothrix sp. AR3]|nr:hypothetical protein [Candidatus Electrothrix sp. AR3]
MESSDLQANIASTLQEAPHKKSRMRCFFGFCSCSLWRLPPFFSSVQGGRVKEAVAIKQNT